jgi:xylan 1,4-beta-xylosidase
MEMIVNPILPGFNPDPSIVRAGDDYYIATSTFEWFPGVQVHHSRDLVHWTLIGHPLDRVSLLDLRGTPTSGGVWAPCLSYDNGTFYLVYTHVTTLDGVFKDTHNYLSTARSIDSPWSERIYLNSSGFDPSLFHDDDGRKWLVNPIREFRSNRRTLAGIGLQEYSVERRCLTGPVYSIFTGTELGCTEGPHLYKYNGRYYLIVAEGGTGYGHAVTVARADTITGPYELDPENPMLSSRDDETLALQKAGHASLVHTHTDEWYMVHLCGRPIMPQKRCMLGRETAIQRCCWSDDGWVRLDGGGTTPRTRVVRPKMELVEKPPVPVRDDFESGVLDVNFSTLRVPADESWVSLTQRRGFLRLYGRESLSSKFDQSLVARRMQAFHFRVETAVEYEPVIFQQMAGLICFYDTMNYYYLRITADERRGKTLGIILSENGIYREYGDDEVECGEHDRWYLAAEVDTDTLQFFYSSDAKSWHRIGPGLDCSTLSDEYCKEGRFTGAFVGVCAQDLSGNRLHADFDYFEYNEYHS